MNCEGFDLEHQIKYMYEYIQDVLMQSQSLKLRDQKSSKETQESEGLDSEILNQIKVDLARTNTTARSKTKQGQ